MDAGSTRETRWKGACRMPCQHAWVRVSRYMEDGLRNSTLTTNSIITRARKPVVESGDRATPGGRFSATSAPRRGTRGRAPFQHKREWSRIRVYPCPPSSPRKRGSMIIYPQMAQMNADSFVPTQGVAGSTQGGPWPTKTETLTTKPSPLEERSWWAKAHYFTMERPVGAGHVPPTGMDGCSDSWFRPGRLGKEPLHLEL